MVGAAETLFEEYLGGGWPTIQKLPEQGRQGSPYTWSSRATLQLVEGPTKMDRKHLSEALSGFPSAAGGMVVWGGVDARELDGEDEVHAILKAVEVVARGMAPPTSTSGGG